MSSNIAQVYAANPTNGTIPPNTLIYLGLSPYGLNNDSASLFSNVSANIIANLGNLPASAYAAGTISQTGLVITGNGTTFTSAMDGGYFFPASGTVSRVFFIDSTHLFSSIAQTISPGTGYALSYYPNKDLIDIQLPATVGMWESAALIAIGNSESVLSNRGFALLQDGFTTTVSDEDMLTSGALVSQSNFTITGSGGTAFDPTYVGTMLLYSNGQQAFINDYSSPTSLTSYQSQTVPLTSFINTTTQATFADDSGNFGTNNAWIHGTINFPAYKSSGSIYSSFYIKNSISTSLDISNTDGITPYSLINLGSPLSSNFGVITLNQGNLTALIGSGAKTATDPAFFHAQNQGTTSTNTAYFSAEVTSSSAADAYSNWKITGGSQFSAGLNGTTGLWNISTGATPSSGTSLLTLSSTTISFLTAQVVKTRAVIATPDTVLSNDFYLGINVSTDVTENIPAATGSGRVLMFKDKSGNAAINNITLTPASGNIEGLPTFPINTDGGSVVLIDDVAGNWSAN